MENKNHNNIFHREAFLLKTICGDGYSVIIGGICQEGKSKESIQSYSEISKIKLGQTKDEFLIDYILANAITKLSPEWIYVVGASVHIQEVKKLTGGIIGNPFEEHESVKDQMEEITPGIFLISLAGGPGVAFKGTYDDGILLEKILQENYISQNIKIEKALKKLNEISELYILVADGSGEESSGRIVICDNNLGKCEKFK